MTNALVTGGARGIGRACVMELARRGADVAVNALPDGPDADAMISLATQVRSLGRRFVACEGDVGDRATAMDAAARAERELGPLDVLVNNAGICPHMPFLDVDPETWDRTFAVNVDAAFVIAQHVARGMVSRGSGSIVFVTSYNAHLSAPRQVHYAASKAALDMLGKGMARELGASGVRVNMVAPAAIVTDLSREYWSSERSRDELEWLVPMNRPGTPEDVARAVAWLASDEASFVNGASLVVDGGFMTSKR